MYTTQMCTLSKSITEVFFKVFFTVMQNVYHCEEGNGSTVEGALESMLLRGLPVDLFLHAASDDHA